MYCTNHLKKDPNFEFLSTWNITDYDEVPPDTPVTEMTDEKFKELGFPVDKTGSSDVLVRPPTDNVINNPFITFVSRKYPHGSDCV